MSSSPSFLLPFLAWSGGLSGADRHVLEMAARWREHVDVAVVAPPQALATLRSFLGDVPAHVLGVAGPRIGTGPMLALEYVRRALAATVRRLPRADVVVAASHFTPDAAGLAAGVCGGAAGGSLRFHPVPE